MPWLENRLPLELYTFAGNQSVVGFERSVRCSIGRLLTDRRDKLQRHKPAEPRVTKNISLPQARGLRTETVKPL